MEVEEKAPMNQNIEEKSWQQTYWEEQERQEREKAAKKMQKIGLIMLVTGVVLLVAGFVWSAFRAGIFGDGEVDVNRAESSGQKAYFYFNYMSEVYVYDDDENYEYRFVADEYGHMAFVCIHKVDAKEYEDYQNEDYWYGDILEEAKLEGYAMTYDKGDKEVLGEFLAEIYRCDFEDVDDEMLEESFGEYYLLVDESRDVKAIVSVIALILGIVLSAAGVIIYSKKNNF